MSVKNLSFLPTPEIRSQSDQDVELWAALKVGNKKALSQIYAKYFSCLYNYGIRTSKDAGLVEDCIQDLFIECWNTRESLGEVRNIKYYFYKSLRRKIVRKLTLQSRLSLSKDLNSFEIKLSDKTHYLNNALNNDLQKRLKQLIETLTTNQKEAIFLIYFDQLPYEEVASIMNLKVKTIYNLIHLAVSKLREHKESLILQ